MDDKIEKWQAEQWRTVVNYINDISGETIANAQDLINIMTIMAVKATGRVKLVEAEPNPNSLS